MQTFIGTKYVFGNFEVSPMIEIDFEDDFSKDHLNDLVEIIFITISIASII